GFEGSAGSQELFSQRQDSATAVKDEDVLAAANFHAGRVAAITDRIGPRTGNRAARAPKAHTQSRRADPFYASTRDRFIANLRRPLHLRSFSPLSEFSNRNCAHYFSSHRPCVFGRTYADQELRSFRLSRSA